MADSFEFYIHFGGSKKICRVESGDEIYAIFFNDEPITNLKYDHHGKWYQVGGSELPYETIVAIGDGIDSYLLSH